MDARQCSKNAHVPSVELSLIPFVRWPFGAFIRLCELSGIVDWPWFSLGRGAPAGLPGSRVVVCLPLSIFLSVFPMGTQRFWGGPWPSLFPGL